MTVPAVDQPRGTPWPCPRPTPARAARGPGSSVRRRRSCADGERRPAAGTDAEEPVEGGVHDVRLHVLSAGGAFDIDARRPAEVTAAPADDRGGE